MTLPVDMNLALDPGLYIPGRSPVVPVEVDKSHQLADGLFLSAGGDMSNLVHRGGIVESNNASHSANYLDVTAGAGNYYRVESNYPEAPINNNRAITLQIELELTAAPSGAWGIGTLNGGTTAGASGYVGFRAFGTTSFRLIGREDYKASIDINYTSFSWSVGRRYILVATISETDQAIYSDGKKLQSSSVDLSGWDFDRFRSYNVGPVYSREWVAAVAASGPLRVFNIRAWNREFSESEILMLSRNSNQFLRVLA